MKSSTNLKLQAIEFVCVCVAVRWLYLRHCEHKFQVVCHNLVLPNTVGTCRFEVFHIIQPTVENVWILVRNTATRWTTNNGKSCSMMKLLTTQKTHRTQNKVRNQDILFIHSHIKSALLTVDSIKYSFRRFFLSPSCNVFWVAL